MINRLLIDTIEGKLGLKGKAIVLLGARQTGKTTLLKKVFENKSRVLWLNGDEMDTIALFSNASSARFRELFAGYSVLVIDEAQRIEDIGLRLKLITDHIPEIQVVATGSSAFELSNRINEPLTGRKWEYNLYSLSFQELVNQNGILEEKRLLHHRLVFGCYPEVVCSPGNEKNVLKQLTDSYLYKDILMWEKISKPDKLLSLLQALALQLGNEVSFNELGRLVGLDNQTVEKYIQLLEKTFVIFRLLAFSRNQRKELKRGRKIYFYDNGIRNSLIASFAQPELRSDVGALWENYLMSERIKFLHYNDYWANRYFWRTQDQQEIDYIEERDGVFYAWEFKWNTEKKVRLTKTFANAYPNHQFGVINPENYEDFLLIKRI